jgi:undecaprenyl-diphosphatase
MTPVRSSLSISGPARLLLAIGVLLVIGGAGLQGTPLDRSALLALNSLAPSWAVSASTLSVLGLGTSVLVLAGLLGASRPALPAAVLLAILAGGLLVQLLKWGLGAPRPLAVLGASELQVIGAALHVRSMPSGHAAMVASLAAMTGLALPANWHPRRRRAAVAVLTLAALFGMAARVVVGAHWPADVLVGGGLGLIAAALLLGVKAPRDLHAATSRWMAGRAGSRAMAALLVAASASMWVAERDYPLVGGLYGALSGVGLLAALRWWRLHPGPDLPGFALWRQLRRIPGRP